MIPPRTRRTVAIPAAPKGTVFYRKDSKRILKEGEILDDSEDDVDYGWIRQEHANVIDDFSDVSLSEREFIKRYSDHILREKIAADCFLPASLERFARANKAWLQLPQNKIEFFKLLSKYVMYGQIAHEVPAACLQILKEDQSKTQLEPDTPRRSKRDLRQQTKASSSPDIKRESSIPLPTEVIETLDSKPSSQLQPAQPGAYCDCGGSWDMSVMCICEAPDCQVRYYHLKCVGLERRVAGWQCSKCTKTEASSPSPKAPPQPLLESD